MLTIFLIPIPLSETITNSLSFLFSVFISMWGISSEYLLAFSIKLLNELDNTINISINCNQKEVLLNSDKEQLARVFFNLIKNSIESIQQRAENVTNLVKKITIEVNEENNHIIVNIMDNGIGFGIFAANIKDILNPYFTTKKNGTGLGLSIVSKIINDHNGTLKIIPNESGAKIKINIPKNVNWNSYYWR